MKVVKFVFFAALLILLAAGCGGGGASTTTYTTANIASDSRFDGDISRNAYGAYLVTDDNAGGLYVGYDEVANEEYRGFLNFPLSRVPLDAEILGATLDLYIEPMSSSYGTIPLRVDLVSFDVPLVGSDFERGYQPTLREITAFFTPSAGAPAHIFLDVTPLLREAQRLKLPAFQIRIASDSASPALLWINNTNGPERSTLAPLLSVDYR